MPIWPDSCIKTEWVSNVPEILENHSFLNMNDYGRKFHCVVTRVQINPGVRQDPNRLT